MSGWLSWFCPGCDKENRKPYVDDWKTKQFYCRFCGTAVKLGGEGEDE